MRIDLLPDEEGLKVPFEPLQLVAQFQKLLRSGAESSRTR